MVGGNNLTSLSYILNFTEPSETAVMAIKGFESSEALLAGFRQMCNCTRVGSPWNFASTVGTGFMSVSTQRIPDYKADNFRTGWNLNNYSGPSSNAVIYAGSAGALQLVTTVCGPESVPDSLGHPQGLQSPRSWYWGLRRMVTQTLRCGTNPPIRSPTLKPSSSPTNIPTINNVPISTSNPTSTLPSLSPTVSPSMSQPTSSPSMSQPTSSPSISQPTGVPSLSPSYCVPGVVTCCLTAQESLVQLYVNEIDITEYIEPRSKLSDASATKIVTFVEPSGPAVLAIKGYERNEIKIAALMLICLATRIGSSWNFVSRHNPVGEWKSIRADTSTTDAFPPNWYSNFNLTSLVLRNPVQSTENININASCGTPNIANKVQPAQGTPARAYWTLRRFVNQSVECGTNSPFSPLPTGSPVFAPTRSPSNVPSMSFPTARPSNLPTTLSPISFVPTNSPSISPTICTPGVVTCCFTAQTEIRQLFVDDQNITTSITPQESLNNPFVSKTVTFNEPDHLSVIGIKGYENNEFYPASLMLKCVCTNPSSNWNFVSNTTSWVSVSAETTRDDLFPSNWYSPSYEGPFLSIQNLAGDNSYTLSSPSCGDTSTVQQIRVPQGSPSRFYWTARKMVDKTCLL